MIISVVVLIDTLVAAADAGGEEGVDIREEKPDNEDGIQLHELYGLADGRKGWIEDGPDQRVLQVVARLSKRDQPRPPWDVVLGRHQSVGAHAHEE